MAGKTEQYSERWCSITSDRWILNTVSDYKVELFEKKKKKKKKQIKFCSMFDQILRPGSRRN